MKKLPMTVGCICGCVCGFMAGGWMLSDSAADADVQPDSAESTDSMVRAMMEAAKPGPAHEVLRRLVGDWNYVFTMPGMDPVRGECEFEDGLGGRCVRYEAEMEMRVGNHTIETEGFGVLSYNRHTEEYQSVWVDSLDPYMVYQTGKMEDGKLSLVGPHYQGGKAMPMKSVYVFHSPDRFDLEFYSKMAPEGEWIKAGTIEYTRD